MSVVGGGIHKPPQVGEPKNECSLAAAVSYTVLETSNCWVYLLLQPFNRLIGAQRIHRSFEPGDDESSLAD
jgi:hypothetical protein